MGAIKGLLKVWYLFLFMVLVGFLFYFLGSKFRFRVNRMVNSQRVFFEVPREKIRAVKLKNGMKVVVFQNDLKPKVLMRLCYDVGSANEQSYERGLAHLVEHMIFKGTEKLSETDIKVIAEKYGATLNAATSYDNTSYYFETDKENWLPFLDILADCMKNARFDQQALASELKTVVAELNGKRDNFVRSMYLKAMEFLFPTNHPYHFPVIGFKEVLAGVTAKEVFDFYHRYYRPSNAVLFVIGDVSLDEVLHAAKISFENIIDTETDVNAVVAKPSFPSVLQPLEEITHKVYEDVKTEELCFFWSLPGQKEVSCAVAELADAILGGDSNSILYRRLVDKEAIAQNVQSGMWMLKEASVVYVLIKPKPGFTSKCEEILKEELGILLTNGVSQEEISRRVPLKAKEFIEGLQNFESMSYSWMQFYFAKGKIYEYFNFIDDLYDVKADVINEFFRSFISHDLFNKIHLLPLPSEKRELWAKNRKIILDQENDILKNHVRTTPVEEARFALSMPSAKMLNFQIPKLSSQVKLNGVDVAFYHDDRLPITNFILRFKNAEYSEYALEEDFSLMMGLLLEGSIGFSKQNHLDFFEAMGASCYFGISGVTCSVLEANFLPVLERIFYILKNPTFRRDAFEKVREIRAGAILRAQNSPSQLSKRCFWRTIFKGAEFDYGFDDMLARVNNLSLRDIVAAHDRLNSNEIVLGVSGKFNQEEVLSVLTRLTKNNHRSPDVVSKTLPQPNTETLKDTDIELLRDQIYVFLGTLIDVAITDQAYPYLKLASYVTFRGLSSRIFKIREATGLFYFCCGNLVANVGLTFSKAYVEMLLGPSRLEEGERAIKEMLNVLARDGVTQEELDGARRDYLCGLLDSYSSSNITLETFLWYLARDLSVELPQIIWNSIKMAEIDQVNNALHQHFDPSKMCRIRVGNALSSKSCDPL